jgi:hypothetical protein
MADTKLANTPASSGEAQVNTYTIYPNGGGQPLKVFRGFRSLKYYESIFDTSVRVESEIIDAGAKEINIIDRLKLTSGEKIEIALEDGYKNKLKTTLRLKNYDYQHDAKAVFVSLSMWSKEMIDNEDTKKRVIKKYIGLISDSVTDIIKNTLGTSLPIDVDTSLGEFIFTGNKSTATPFDMCLTLCSKSVPDMPNAKGILAGYLFYQTSEAFKFKSVDKLFSEPKKAKFIYNDKVEMELPPGYDAKILTFKFNKSMDIEEMMKGGVFSQNEQIGFNPYQTEYKEPPLFDANSQNMKKNNAGNQIPSIAEDLNFAQRSFHLSGKIDDTGEFMKDPNAWSTESKEVNYPVADIMRQAKARYHQLHTSSLSITIPMNLKLHAGDMIECDFPEVSDKKTKIVTKRKSGLYMIEELVHNISLSSATNGQPANLTTLSLIRDTEGKK